MIKYLVFFLLFAQSVFAGGVLFTAGGVSTGGGGGTVSYVDSTLTRGTNTSLTCTKPTGTVTGDRIYAFVLDDTAQAVTSTGWTEIVNQESSSSRQTLLYRDALTADTTYDFTVSASSDFQVHLITLEKTAGTWSHTYNNTSATSTTITIPAVNMADNSVLLSGFGSDDAIAITTPPTGMTQTQTEQQGSSRMYTYRQVYASQTSSVTKSATWSGSGDLSGISVSVEAQ